LGASGGAAGWGWSRAVLFAISATSTVGIQGAWMDGGEILVDNTAKSWDYNGNGHFRNRLIGGTYHICLAYFSGLCQGIYP